MNLILLVGNAGVGKNELALKIKNSLDKTVITSLSKYIKLFALEYTDWDGKDITKPRTFLQEMGDKLRSKDKNFLINRLLEDIEIYKDDFDNIIISDVRLLNEINAFKSLKDFNVICVKVDGVSRKELSFKEMNHITETELKEYKDFDYIIKDNNIEELLEGLR